MSPVISTRRTLPDSSLPSKKPSSAMPNSSRTKTPTGSGRRRQTPAAEAAEMLWMAIPDGGEIDRRAAWHQCFSSSPIRRWRTREVSMSMIATVTRTSTRIAETSE